MSAPHEPNGPSAHDAERVAKLRPFLREHGFAWRGYRKKRKGVWVRLHRRLEELGIPDLESYSWWIAEHPAEVVRLHALIGISVARFFRDRLDWELVRERVIRPWLAAGHPRRAWSMGCASGEEPYTLRMIWLAAARAYGTESAGSLPPLSILATDVREELLERARRAIYPVAARRHIPAEFLREFTAETDAGLLVDSGVLSGVEFKRHDYLTEPWPGEFDLILARNGPFTYRAAEELAELLRRLAAALRPGGFLFVGSNDVLPQSVSDHFTKVGRTLWQLHAEPVSRRLAERHHHRA